MKMNEDWSEAEAEAEEPFLDLKHIHYWVLSRE